MKGKKIPNSKQCVLLLFLVALIEGVVRVFIQPDPWTLHPTHWYFNQPLRLFIEASMVTFLFAVVHFFMSELLKIRKADSLLLLISTGVCVAFFSVLEFSQLSSALGADILTIVLWLLTGFCIGMGQELVFRGMLYTSLLGLTTERLSKLLTTTLFVLAPLHSVRLWDLMQQGQLWTVVLLVSVYVLVSLFFQWLRDKTGSVMVPGVVHGAGNAITWLAVFS